MFQSLKARSLAVAVTVASIAIASPALAMEFNVNIHGRTITLEAEPTTTISEVATMIAGRITVSETEMYLYLSSSSRTPLDQSRTLADYNIQEHTTIAAVIKRPILRDDFVRRWPLH